MNERLDNRRPQKRLLAIVFAISLVFSIGLGGWFHHSRAQTLHQSAIDSLAAIAEHKCEQIRMWRKERLADADTLVSDPFLAEAIDHYLQTRDATTQIAIEQRFQSLCQHYDYDNVLLVAADGTPVLCLHGDPPATHEYQPFLTNAFARQQSVFTSLHQGHGIWEAPHISVVAPIFKQAKPNHPPLAGVLMSQNAQDYLFPLLDAWPVPTKTAETVLFRRDDDHIKFLNETRLKSGTTLREAIPLTVTDNPLVKAINGETGVIEGRDYRNAKVVSYIVPVPDSPWFIETKQDASEIYSNWLFESVLIVVLFSVISACLASLFLLIWQRRNNFYMNHLYRQERLLREEVQRHSITLRAIGDAVIATDALGHVKLLNPVAEQLTGWQEADALDRPLEEVFHIINEQTRAIVENPVQKAIASDKIVGLANHTILVDKQGKERPIADSAAPIRDDKRQIIGVVLVFRDQTHEHNYRILFNEMLDAFASHEIICDESGNPVDYRFLNVNPAFEEMTGWKACDIIGKTVLEVMPNTEKRWIDTYGKVALTGEPIRFENFSQAINRHFNVSAFRSAPMQFTTIFTDITERVRMEEQARQSQKMESIGRLAGGVAHDFNNMLGAIMGHAELVLEELGPDDPHRSAIEEIIGASKRAGTVTKQLLGFARRQTIAPQVLDLNDTVETMLSMLRRLIGEHIDLQWTPATKSLPVCMDPSQIDQILVNLCINARDAIDKSGRIAIKTAIRTFDAEYCEIHADAREGDFALIEASDDGCGMDAETLKNIFEPFFTTKEIGQGTGLGLATVYGIVRQNKGFINVYSESGKGTVFNIYIPLQPQPPGANETQEPKPHSPKRTTGQTILIVEDDPTILKIGTKMLKRIGYHVIGTQSPEDAIKIAESKQHKIDLLISDVVMPKINGSELADRLTQIHPELKVLYMSGYTADMIGHHGILESDANFIQKPFSVTSLTAAVQRILSSNRTA